MLSIAKAKLLKRSKFQVVCPPHDDVAERVMLGDAKNAIATQIAARKETTPHRIFIPSPATIPDRAPWIRADNITRPEPPVGEKWPFSAGYSVCASAARSGGQCPDHAARRKIGGGIVASTRVGSTAK